MDNVVKKETMYRDMINILKESGLADLIKTEDFKKYATHTTHLKRGHFYLASRGGGLFGYIFYVNPIDWFGFGDKGVGLVYLTLDAVREVLKDPTSDPNFDELGGWNNPYSDIYAIEDYRGSRELILFKSRADNDSNYDFFRTQGYVFYELSDSQTQRLGVFNWWW